MIRLGVIGGLLTAAWLVSAAHLPAQEKSRLGKDCRDDLSRAVDEKLDHWATLKINNLPLDEAIYELRKVTELNFTLDRAALADAHIDPKTPVFIDVDNIPLRSSLKLMLQELKLTWDIKFGVVNVTTPAGAAGPLKTVTYSVADLVAVSHSSDLADIDTVLIGKESEVLPHRTREDELIKIITRTIAPESWDSAGGTGTIQFFPLGASLVVEQTADNHEQVADLLAQLRRRDQYLMEVDTSILTVSRDAFAAIASHLNLDVADLERADITPAPRFQEPLKSSTFDYRHSIESREILASERWDAFPDTPKVLLDQGQVHQLLGLAQGDRWADYVQLPQADLRHGQRGFYEAMERVSTETQAALPVFCGGTMFQVGTQFWVRAGVHNEDSLKLALHLTDTRIAPKVTDDRAQEDGSQTQEPCFWEVFTRTYLDPGAARWPLESGVLRTLTVGRNIVIPNGKTALLYGGVVRGTRDVASLPAASNGSEMANANREQILLVLVRPWIVERPGDAVPCEEPARHCDRPEVAPSESAAAPMTESSHSGDRPPSRPIGEALDSPISLRMMKLRFDEAHPVFETLPLDKAVTVLSWATGLTIELDRAALADANFDVKTPVSMHGENIPLRSALDLLLRDTWLTYTVKDGAILITTRAAAFSPVAPHVADGDKDAAPCQVPDPPACRTESAPEPGPADPMRLVTYAVGDLVTPMREMRFSGNSGTNTSSPLPRTCENELIQQIISTIAPKSWAEAGGQGTIQYFPLGMSLVVRQKFSIQLQVAAFLEKQRKLRNTEVAIETRLIDVDEGTLARLEAEVFHTCWPQTYCADSARATDAAFKWSGSKSVMLTDALVADLLRIAQNGTGKCQPISRFTLFHEESGVVDRTEKVYYLSSTRAVETDDGLELTQCVQSVQTGITYSVVPTIAEDFGSVTLRLAFTEVGLAQTNIPVAQPKRCWYEDGCRGDSHSHDWLTTEDESLPRHILARTPFLNVVHIEPTVAVPDRQTAILLLSPSGSEPESRTKLLLVTARIVRQEPEPVSARTQEPPMAAPDVDQPPPCEELPMPQEVPEPDATIPTPEERNAPRRGAAGPEASAFDFGFQRHPF